MGFLGILSCGPDQEIEIKVMSYNIKHGVGLDTILDLTRSANIIKEQAPDLCALQEIDDSCMRSGSISQTDQLARHTGLTGTFGKFMDFQGGEYGMATLIGKPLISTKVLKLPDGKYEPRTAIVHEVQLADNCIIAFANVHLDWIGDDEGSANRLKQAKTLVAYLNVLNRAAIITGDFNCTPDSPTMRYFEEQGFEFVNKGKDRFSFQGDRKAEIDHLIFRNTETIRFKSKNTVLLDEPIVSDHRPLITELEVVF